MAATNLTSTSVTLNGIVNANSFSSNVIFEYGTTTSYGQEVTPEQGPVTGNASINVSTILAGLTCGTIYHFRIKAENSSGISYGSDKTINSDHLPTLKTTSASGITATTAIIEGKITDYDCVGVIEKGFYWSQLSISLPPQNRSGKGYYRSYAGTGTGSFTSKLTGLSLTAKAAKGESMCD